MIVSEFLTTLLTFENVVIISGIRLIAYNL